MMRITLLGSSDCPNTPPLRQALCDALTALGVEGFEELDQGQLVEDHPWRGYPTPTILVNGRDLYGLAPPMGAQMRCRVYPGGIPGSQEIARPLAEDPVVAHGTQEM